MTQSHNWKPLPDAEWQSTIRSLHRWSQVVGKIRLALADPLNHWWHVPLYVSARGLTTSVMSSRSGPIELEFDLHAGSLVLRTSDRTYALPLGPMSVRDFYDGVIDLLAEAELAVPIRPVPVEVVDAPPFPVDLAPGGYEPVHARALHGALLNSQRVLTRFRGRYLGKASPVHFFWGSFDLATTRFSGLVAPRHPGGVPNCPDWVMVEAYSHEVSSAGWWPGPEGEDSAFYAYMYPEPAGYGASGLELSPGTYREDLGEFVLRYADVVDSDDPEATVLTFLEETYARGATLAGWDRDDLELKQVAGQDPARSHRAPEQGDRAT